MFSGVGTDVTVAVVEFSTSVFTPFSGIADILGLGLGTNDVSTAVTFDRLPLLLLLLALLLPVLLLLLFAQLLLLLLLLDTAILTAGANVLLLLLLLLLMILDETDEGVAFVEILGNVTVGALVLDGATDILLVVAVAVEEGGGTTVEGVALRDGVAFAGAGLVDTGAVVDVAVVLLFSEVEAAVVGKDDGDESEPAASFSCSVSSFTAAASGPSGPGSVEFTFDVLLLSFVVLFVLPLLLLLFVVLVILLILVAVVDVVVAVAEDTVAAASGGDAADVVTVLVTGATAAADDTVAVVVVVDALHTAVLVLILPALQLLLLLLLLLLVLFEDEFVETLDAELFPIELFVEFAARSRPTVFCCCSRCSLVVTPVVSASTMHCVGF